MNPLYAFDPIAALVPVSLGCLVFGFFFGIAMCIEFNKEDKERYKETIKKLQQRIEEQKHNPPTIDVVVHFDDSDTRPHKNKKD